MPFPLRLNRGRKGRRPKNRVFIDTSKCGKDFRAIGIEANRDTGGGSVSNNRVAFTNSTGNGFPGQLRIGFLFRSPNLQFPGNVLSGIAEIGFDVFSDSDSIVGTA